MTHRPPTLSYAPPDDPAARPPWRLWVALVTLLVGVVVARWLFGSTYPLLVTLGPWGFVPLAVVVVVAIAVSAIPPVGRPLARWYDRISQPVPARSRRLGVLVTTIASAAFLFATARGQHRPTGPTLHDEFSYLIQARQFAAFHLWYRPHPLADFFDNFQLFSRPVYASAYFPGTALLYVPGVWLHLPPRATSIAVAAVVAGLFYRVAAELVDGPSAVLSVLLLWCVTPYRAASAMTLAQMPLLLYALAAIVSWLRWRIDPRPLGLLWVGLALGLAAITRPVDALCFALPLIVAIAADLRRSPEELTTEARRHGEEVGESRAASTSSPRLRASSSPMLRAAVLLATGLLPSVALQLTLNRGITGRWTETPFRLYADRDYPGTAYGFAPPPPDARPASPLPQKQSLYREYQPLIREHTPATVWHLLVAGFGNGGYSPARLPLAMTAASPVPFYLLFPLLFVAPLAATARQWVLLCTGPLFLALYAGYVFFFPHYTLACAPAVALAVAVAGRHLSRVVPRPLAAAVPLLLFAVAVAGLPQWDATTDDDIVDAPTVAAADAALAALPPGPAVVLFTWSPSRSNHDEPAYTAAAGWPDDARIVRAHDLGPARDRDLFRYYAERQPARVAYRFDERTGELSRLGTVTDLAR